MWPAALAAVPVRELLAGVPPAVSRSLRFAGLPESEIAASLRAFEAHGDLSGVEVTTCLRRSELEVDLRPWPGAEPAARVLALASFRGTLGAQKEDYALLEITHGREPLAGAVRKGDDRWFDIVRYTFNAQIAAEELGITSATVAGLAGSTVPDIRRLLGADGDLGPSLGLDKAWAANVIARVGNYGEMFDRALGASGMPRGQNRLVGEGGLMFALPMR